jgi:hypothetical protein
MFLSHRAPTLLLHFGGAFRSALMRLKIKMQRLARTLMTWSKPLFSDARVQFHMAQELIMCLVIAQESRAPTDAEFPATQAEGIPMHFGLKSCPI